jgi:hypothetical protein
MLSVYKLKAHAGVVEISREDRLQFPNLQSCLTQAGLSVVHVPYSPMQDNAMSRIEETIANSSGLPPRYATHQAGSRPLACRRASS